MAQSTIGYGISIFVFTQCVLAIVSNKYLIVIFAAPLFVMLLWLLCFLSRLLFCAPTPLFVMLLCFCHRESHVPPSVLDVGVGRGEGPHQAIAHHGQGKPSV